MNNNIRVKTTIAWILNIGVLLSLILVMAGGLILLMQHGHEPTRNFILLPAQITVNPFTIWHTALQLDSISLIELGLFALIATQVVRVMLLALYYLSIRDIWFSFFSLFVLAAMFVGVFLR